MESVVSFDFGDKKAVDIDPAEVHASRESGCYCWIDLAACERQRTREVLAMLGISDRAIDLMHLGELDSQFHVAPDCVHFTLLEARYVEGVFRIEPLDVVVGNLYMVTIRGAQSPTIDGVLETYLGDFLASAQSPGFMLFELADHLIGSFRGTLTLLSTKVEKIQAKLLDNVGDEILAEVADLTRSLMDYRKAVVSGREIIHELATRQSPFVQRSTQAFLEKQTLPLERLAHDAATERAVLSEISNLYMGLVSHRTNRVVNRLTIVSMIFLPLSFLVGLYGMNFEHMPELHWRFGYALFWGLVLVIVAGLLVLMRRKRWI